MGFAHYLAMTRQEMTAADTLPEKGAWMSCRFSEDGICGIPEELPEGWLLVLDDSRALNPEYFDSIPDRLAEIIEKYHCFGLVLDFQKLKSEALAAWTQKLADTLPCPIAAPPAYALPNHPVFLEPVPLTIPLKEHIAPWQNREIWLETALNCEIVTLTSAGTSRTPLPGFMNIDTGFENSALHCHYLIEERVDSVVFTLWRTRKDLMGLIREAEELGIRAGIGLYQELGIPSKNRREE